MKSRTSFFNLTAFRKDIFRFFPLWGLYTVFLLLILFATADSSAPHMARDMMDFAKAMSWINLIYGGLCGAFLLMDLFNGRLCNALHAFPLRRESWLTTHILSGVLFSLVPNLLLTLLASLLLKKYAYMALIWLAVSTLQYLFFFGSAVLCGVCAGNLIGMGALYGIFHFITVLVQAVAQLLYEPLLHGIKLNSAMFYRYFPAYQLGIADYAEYRVHFSEHLTFGQFEGLVGASWRYAGICAGVGIALAVLAYLVYRRRQLESAGDFISLRPLAPLFLIICTVGAGAIFYAFSELFSSETYILLIFGGVIGYFAGSMLLNRTLKVFNKKAFVGLGVVAAVFAGSLLLTYLDPLGVTRYVPNIDKIESANVFSSESYYLASSIFGYDSYDENKGYQITNPEELEELLDLHGELVEHRPITGRERTANVGVRYVLKSGRVVVRYYEDVSDSELLDRAGKYFSDIRYITGVNDPTVLYDAIEAVYVEGEKFSTEDSFSFKFLNQEEIAGFVDALIADCNAGVVAQNWEYHENAEMYSFVNIELNRGYADDGFRYESFYLNIWTDCTNTVQYLEELFAKYSEQ